jgi:antitoxin component HigA of HigAB toxin-antitoxin module
MRFFVEITRRNAKLVPASAEHEMNASDLGRLLGNRELGSKVLRGERNISRSNAKALSAHFALPAKTFLR